MMRFVPQRILWPYDLNHELKRLNMCDLYEIKQYFLQSGNSPSGDVDNFVNSVLECGLSNDVPQQLSKLVIQWAEADPGVSSGHLANEIVGLCQGA